MTPGDDDKGGDGGLLGGVEPETQVAARALSRRLSALPETAMRGAVLSEALGEMAIARAAGVIATIAVRGRRGGPPFELALGALDEMLRSGRLPYELHCELYREVKALGLGEMAGILLPGAGGVDILGVPGPKFPGGRELTLGERKSLARAAPRDVLARLMRDDEPQVIRLLLRNPRLIERDVVFIASRRPAPRAALREIVANQRWIARYAVKRALLLNPGTPEELALRLLPAMRAPDLRGIASDHALPSARRQAAARLVAQLEEG